MIPISAFSLIGKRYNPEERRNLGHEDFKIAFTALIMSATTYIQSPLINNPKWVEFLNTSTAISFVVALFGFAIMGYNFAKSTPSLKK